MARKPRASEETIDKIWKMYNDGKTHKEIAKEVDMLVPGVYKILKIN